MISWPAPAERARHVAGNGRPPRRRWRPLSPPTHTPSTTSPSRPAKRWPPPTPLMDRLPEGERSDTWLTYGEQKHHAHLSHA
ncbi:hypothetical protein [Streptomyces sp. NRRL S-455]|uniref:hypothetical protein n=1 Tax=Streptomyces sp. NRRL S-455 TaxID=1463908 RepID=UPI000AD09EF2|nr:hypothetical protein [Streptomyces sp. NRRL S-455]